MLDLKIHLIKLGITQKDLAANLGISTQYMTAIVRGHRKAPRIRQQLRSLGMPADYTPPKKILPRKAPQAA